MGYQVPTRESEERKRTIAIIRALAACVNAGAIVQVVEQPHRGSYRADIPFEQQTRTVTFVVKADAYDDAFPSAGRQG